MEDKLLMWLLDGAPTIGIALIILDNYRRRKTASEITCSCRSDVQALLRKVTLMSEQMEELVDWHEPEHLGDTDVFTWKRSLSERDAVLAMPRLMEKLIAKIDTLTHTLRNNNNNNP